MVRSPSAPVPASRHVVSAWCRQAKTSTRGWPVLVCLWSVSSLDWPGCHSQGETRDAAPRLDRTGDWCHRGLDCCQGLAITTGRSATSLRLRVTSTRLCSRAVATRRLSTALAMVHRTFRQALHAPPDLAHRQDAQEQLPRRPLFKPAQHPGLRLPASELLQHLGRPKIVLGLPQPQPGPVARRTWFQSAGSTCHSSSRRGRGPDSTRAGSTASARRAAVSTSSSTVEAASCWARRVLPQALGPSMTDL